MPLASLVRGHGTTPTRLVLFRRPIEHRCETRADLEAMVLTVVVEQVAELLGIDAEDVDPRYTARRLTGQSTQAASHASVRRRSLRPCRHGSAASTRPQSGRICGTRPWVSSSGSGTTDAPSPVRTTAPRISVPRGTTRRNAVPFGSATATVWPCC